MYSEKTPDDGQRKCPKYVEFYSKNKFEKLVHLVGFIMRIHTSEIGCIYKNLLHATTTNVVIFREGIRRIKKITDNTQWFTVMFTRQCNAA